MISFNFIANALSDKDAFRVISFYGQEQISSLYEFNVNVIAKQPDLEFNALMKDTVQLELQHENVKRYFNGILKSFALTRIHEGGLYEYNAVIVPRLWLKTKTTHNRVFLDQSLIDILKEELEGVKFQNSHPNWRETDVCFPQADVYEPKVYTSQFDETDFNFISRLMENEGMYYVFDNNDHAESMILVDDNSDLISIKEGFSEEVKDAQTVQFNSDNLGSAMEKMEISEFSKYQSDYYKHPEKDDENNLALNDVIDSMLGGKVEGSAASISEESGRLALIRDQENLCNQSVYRGKSNHINFSAGVYFDLENCYRPDFNEKYILTKVFHSGRQNLISWEEMSGAHYKNSFESMSYSLTFRPRRTTSTPKFEGVLSAIIEAAKDDNEQADIDEQGRYKVKMGFDKSDGENALSSHRIALAQSHTGESNDGSVPLAPGTKVLVSFINADIDRPVIMAG